MINYNYLVIIGICFFCLGLFVVIRGLLGIQGKTFAQADPIDVNYKNNIPIVPRNQRNTIIKPVVSDVEESPIVYNNQADSEKIAQETDVAMNDELKFDLEDTISSTVTDGDVLNNEQTQTASGIFNIDIPPMGYADRFNGETSMIDVCLRNEISEINEDNQVLFHQKQTLTLIISPRSGEMILGSKIITIAREYGMKYGVLNMFHRYENPEGVGVLWFSMLGVGVDGIKGFDLLDLPQMAYRGLVLFLALPHPQAVRGFDSMVQVAKTIAIEMDADIHDESDYIIDDKKFAQMRHYAAEYKG